MGFLLFISGLAVFYIGNSYYAEKKIRKIEKLQKEIKELRIVQVKDLGKRFSASKKFVEIMEGMLLDFYEGIIQHLKKWEKPAPKISPSDVTEKFPDDIE